MTDTSLTEHERQFLDADFARDFAEFRRKRGHAKDYAGQVGQHLKLSKERHGTHLGAFKLAEKLEGMDSPDSNDFLRGLFLYALRLGLFQRFDLFDDFVTLLRRIVVEFDGNGAPADPSQEEINTERLKGIKALDALTQ